MGIKKHPVIACGVNDGARTHDNQNHNLALYQLNYVHHIGASQGIRTPGPRLRRAMLYPTELVTLENKKNGAGEGNRTLTTSLEGWNSTIELHPRSGRRDSNSRRSPWQGDALPLSHSRMLKIYFPFFLLSATQIGLVQVKGVEPIRRQALDPKSSASANSATPACKCKAIIYQPIKKIKRFLAGIAGFEPTNARVKVWCLTAWPYPRINSCFVCPVIPGEAFARPDNNRVLH